MHFRDLEFMLASAADPREADRAPPVAARGAGFGRAVLSLLRRLIARR
jgi:hypothetical protein